MALWLKSYLVSKAFRNFPMLNKPLTVIFSLLYVFFFTVCLSQSSATDPYEKNPFISKNQSSSDTEYLRTRAYIDSMVNPVAARLLMQDLIDSATLAACDKIITVSKEVYVVNIHNITFTQVRFTYPADNMLNALNRSQVSQILYGDGRIDVFVPLEDKSIAQRHLVDTSRIIIKNQKDWMKVRSTENIEEISNLVSKGKIKVRFQADRGNVDNDYLVRNAMVMLKKKAAGQKAHYVLIESKFFHKAFGDLPSVEINATAYGYE